MIVQNKTISVALTCTQGQTNKKSTQNLNITNSIEVTIIGIARAGGGAGGPGPPPIDMPPMLKMWQKSLVSWCSVSWNIFAYNSTLVQK